MKYLPQYDATLYVRISCRALFDKFVERPRFRNEPGSFFLPVKIQAHCQAEAHVKILKKVAMRLINAIRA
jgi:hypothetical protein